MKIYHGERILGSDKEKKVGILITRLLEYKLWIIFRYLFKD